MRQEKPHVARRKTSVFRARSWYGTLSAVPSNLPVSSPVHLFRIGLIPRKNSGQNRRFTLVTMSSLFCSCLEKKTRKNRVFRVP